MSSKRTAWIPGTLAFLALTFCLLVAVTAEESTRQYFEQMRQRGLYSLAESYCVDRLSNELTPGRRAELSIELSRTYAAHAGSISGPDQEELWERAAQVLEEARQKGVPESWHSPLRAQAAAVQAEKAAWHHWQVLLQPHHAPLRQQAQTELDQAIRQLQAALTDVQEMRQDRGRAYQPGDVTDDEWQQLAEQTRFQLAEALLQRVRVEASDAARLKWVIEAEAPLRELARGDESHRLTWLSQVKLVECARWRGEFEQATKLLTALAKKNPPEFIQSPLLVERVWLMLAIQRPADAALLLSNEKNKPPGLTEELRFLYVRALMEMWKIASTNRDKELAAEFWQQAEEITKALEDQAPGYWAIRARTMLTGAQDNSEYGAEVVALVKQAQAAFGAGQNEQAIELFVTASQAAEKRQQPAVAMQLGYTAASIELQMEQFERAGGHFAELAQTYPETPEAANAHLLYAWCLGRLYDQQRTAERREAYVAALEEHRRQYAAAPTAGEAVWLLAQLQERRLQLTKAVELYREIPAEHAKGPLAQVALARCYEGILQRLHEIQQPVDYWTDLAIRELQGFTGQYPADQPWSLPQAEVGLRLSRILLNHTPPDYARAEQLLARLFTSWEEIRGKSEEPEEEFARTWKPLMMAATQMRIVSLAAQGRPQEAEALIAALSQTAVADVLRVLDGLMQVADQTDPGIQQGLGQLLLKTVESLQKRQTELSPAEKLWLERCLGQAYLATNQPGRALDTYEQLLKSAPDDLDLMQNVAELLMEIGSPLGFAKAQPLWKQLENKLKKGSPAWMNCRYQLALCLYEQGNYAECRKLLGVTKVLYPDLGGEGLQPKFQALEEKNRAHLGS